MSRHDTTGSEQSNSRTRSNFTDPNEHALAREIQRLEQAEVEQQDRGLDAPAYERVRGVDVMALSEKQLRWCAVLWHTLADAVANGNSDAQLAAKLRVLYEADQATDQGGRS